MKTNWRRRLARWLGIGVLAALAATVLPVVMMRWVDPWTSAFMLDAKLDAHLAGRKNYRTDYRWVDYEQISPHAGVAVIASEDQLFPFHSGFDFKSIREAMRTNEQQATRKRPRIRGGSTITQQVAKNLFLWPGRSYLRKGLEAWFTLLIEITWPKERILEVYLNIAQFGDGIYGAEAAAQRFWRKPAARLDRWEAAMLAAVLPSPLRLKANAPSPYVQLRRDQILEQMRGLGGPNYLKELEDPTAPPKTGTPGKAVPETGESAETPSLPEPLEAEPLPTEPATAPPLPEESPTAPPAQEPPPQQVPPQEEPPVEEPTVEEPPPEDPPPEELPPAEPPPDQVAS